MNLLMATYLIIFKLYWIPTKIQVYKINLKAELEIKLLSEKIDHLLAHQNKKLLEIQEVQTDYLEDLMKVLKRKWN